MRIRPAACSLAIAASVAFAPGSALAGGSATSSGKVGVGIVEPIAIQSLEPLQFGVLAVSSREGGSISVDPDSGSTRVTGGVGSLCPARAACFARPARFAVTGEAGRYYRIDAPATATARHDGGGATSLTVSAIRISSANSTDGSARRLLDAGGSDSFAVGGTLSVPAGTQPGIYRAEVAVVVSYD